MLLSWSSFSLPTPYFVNKLFNPHDPRSSTQQVKFILVLGAAQLTFALFPLIYIL